jgi:hypothetical protein
VPAAGQESALSSASPSGNRPSDARTSSPAVQEQGFSGVTAEASSTITTALRAIKDHNMPDQGWHELARVFSGGKMSQSDVESLLENCDTPEKQNAFWRALDKVMPPPSSRTDKINEDIAQKLFKVLPHDVYSDPSPVTKFALQLIDLFTPKTAGQVYNRIEEKMNDSLEKGINVAEECQKTLESFFDNQPYDLEKLEKILTVFEDHDIALQQANTLSNLYAKRVPNNGLYKYGQEQEKTEKINTVTACAQISTRVQSLLKACTESLKKWISESKNVIYQPNALGETIARVGELNLYCLHNMKHGAFAKNVMKVIYTDRNIDQHEAGENIGIISNHTLDMNKTVDGGPEIRPGSAMDRLVKDVDKYAATHPNVKVDDVLLSNFRQKLLDMREQTDKVQARYDQLIEKVQNVELPHPIQAGE